MSIQVKLKDIIEEMEIQSIESRSFLNFKTGEIVLVTSDDFRVAEEAEEIDDLPDWQRENIMIAIDVDKNFENYIELPTKHDINEYEIVGDFCQIVSDQQKQDTLLRAIKGKGAFRRFKDIVIEFQIEDLWYSYRDTRLKQIAIEWCQDNNVRYTE